MNALGQVLVLGLITGGIYGLFALGVVLVYRGTGALNFAQGEIGTFGLYAAWWLSNNQTFPWIVGAIGAVTVSAALGVAFEWVIVRRMVEASRVTIAVATVGLLLFLIAFEIKYFGGDTSRPIAGPIGGIGVKLFGVFVSPTQWIALFAAVAIAVALANLLRRTDFGLGVLAASQDPVAVRLVGVPLRRVSAFVWGAGAAVSAIGGLLIVPTVGGVVPGYASDLFIWGLTAAVIGGLTNLPGAFGGGLLLGIVDVASSRIFDNPSFPAAKFVVLLVLLLAVLVLRPQGVFEDLRLPTALRRGRQVPA